jgi:hypothetical protein
LSFTFLKNLNKGNYLNRQHYLETIETVLSCDLPEASFADAINQQVIRDLGIDDEYAWNQYTNQSDFFH